MANRGDVISVDKLWDIFDLEREKAWEGVEAPVGAPEWNVAAGKIDVINNICHAVHNMNTCSRSDGENAQKPVLKDGVSVVHSDYANGTAKTETQRWREWVEMIKISFYHIMRYRLSIILLLMNILKLLI